MDKVSIVCVLKKNKDFQEKQVEVLANQVRRNMTREYEFVCLTDSTETIEGCDRQIELIHDFPNTWCKMEIFRKGLFSNTVLFLDLDMLIMKPLDSLFDLCKEEEFWSLNGWRGIRRMKLCSAMMLWNGDYSKIYEKMKSTPRGKLSCMGWSGEQSHIESSLRNDYSIGGCYIQKHFPVYSYKWSCREQPPEDTMIVCFHGHPRPWQVTDKWIKECWK